jgi:predicted nucleic acid-binding protein
MGGKVKAVAAQHSLAECFAAFTRIPNLPPVSPAQAREMIRANIVCSFEIVSLGKEDYLSAVDRAAEKNLIGGAFYDALIFQAAIKKKATHLVTWNQKHFMRFVTDELKIATPEDL